MLPFDNVKVIDLSTRAPGPFCSMALADMGADVVMVEAPAGTGSQGGPGPDEVREAAFDPLRRNKRSIVLDLKQAEARQVLYDLAAGADVVMEGFKPGTVERLGADYETLRGVNERLVYCSLSGYGQDGPYRAMPGHDVNYISFAGVLGSMGSPDGTPTIPNNIIADFAAGGLLGAFSIVTALWARERTGRGQYIDLSLTDGSLYLNPMVTKNFFLHGEVTRPGQAFLNGGSPDYRVYRCKDGRFLSVGSLEFKFWRNLCEALERPDWIDRRRSEPAAVAAEMDARFAERTRDEWFDLLGGLDLAIGKVYDVDEAPGDPQLRHRNMFVEVESRDGTTATQIGIPTKLSETPGSIRNEGPPAGRDTMSVLADLGRSQEQIDALIAGGAARQFPVSPALAFSPRKEQLMTAYDKDKTAVLIMDYQREIVANYAGDDPEITTRAAAVLAAARAAGILVVHVIVAFRPGHPEIAPRGFFKAIKGAGRLVLGSPEAEIHPDVAPEGGDLIVTKKRIGAFAGSDLDMLLHAHGIEHLILMGIATSGVVLTTVRVAADMDFEMTVVADCCADMDEEVHRVLTGKVFARGAEIANSADVIAALETLA